MMKRKVLIFCLALATAFTALPVFTLSVAAEKIYDIYTAEEFIAFAESIQDGNTYEGKVVHIRSDLDFTEYEGNWFEHINLGKYFSGIIDGHGHTINGLRYTNDNGQNYRGLLGGRLKSGSITYDEYGGAGAGVFNLSLTDCVLDVNGRYIGGLFGSVESGKSKVVFENVYTDIDINVTDSGTHVGGIVGYNLNSQTVISGCAVVGNITNASTQSELACGGFVGWNGASKNDAALEIRCSGFYGDIGCTASGADMCGVFVGINGKSTNASTLYVESCVATGTASFSDTCKNIGIITGVANGIVEYKNVTVTQALSNVSQYVNGEPITTVSTSSVQGMSATVPEGFTAVPWGYAMPSGTVNFSREQADMSGTATTCYVGMQFGEFIDGYCNLRLVATMSDGKEGKSFDGIRAVGFDITMTVVENGKVWSNSTDGVTPKIYSAYNSIMGGSDTYTADSLGGDYIYIATVDGIKANVGKLIFTVKTFHIDVDGNQVFDDLYVINYDTTQEMGDAEQ